MLLRFITTRPGFISAIQAICTSVAHKRFPNAFPLITMEHCFRAVNCIPEIKKTHIYIWFTLIASQSVTNINSYILFLKAITCFLKVRLTQYILDISMFQLNSRKNGIFWTNGPIIWGGEQTFFYYECSVRSWMFPFQIYLNSCFE